MEKTQQRRQKRIMLFICNAVLIASLLALCVLHVLDTKKDSRAAAEEAFVTGTASMRSLATTVLETEQTAVSDKAAYINVNHMTMEEALTYLSAATTSADVMFHILDYETWMGYSSVAKKDGTVEVDYSSLSDAVKEPAEKVKGGTDTGLVMTRAYTNPITSFKAIGFLADITLDDGQYLLIRVVPVEEISARWSFPVQYEDAELSLIDAEGRYIIRGASLKNENFWEYVRVNNDIGYEGTDALRESFYDGSVTSATIKNSEGVECCLTCMPLQEENLDLYYVAMMPASGLQAMTVDYSLVIIVTLFMLALIAVNVLYIMDINRELRRSNALAHKASRAKTEFLSSMSHDIRTPMNAIIGMTEIASRNTDDPVRVQNCLSKINLASSHLLTLINDVLDISKIESGKLSLNPSAFSLGRLLEEDANIVQTQLADKHLTMTTDTSDLLHDHLFADELRLNQIFLNLTSNAIKYTPEGGHIDVKVSQTPVPENEKLINLEYRITDNGIGMSEDFMKVMFEPFSRVEDSRRSQAQGTGLGLAITKQLVDLMAGTIDCTSKLGEGSTFTVKLTLPLAEEEQRAAAPDEDDGRDLSGLHLLVAEDNDMNWEIVSELLSMHAITSVRAVNGKEAVEMLKEAGPEVFDAILMDIQMPVMNGREATVEIRKLDDPKLRDIPIIAMTADAFAEDIQACLDAGMNAHTAKPINMKKLFEALRKGTA